jgi:hypothetical protein
MRRQRGLPEDLPTQGELDLAQPIREEPIVSHPLKAANVVHCISGFMQFLRLCRVDHRRSRW